MSHPVCGDVVDLHASRSENGIELWFEATACSAVLAFFSFALAELSGGGSRAIQSADVSELAHRAGGLPQGKQHAAGMLREALDEILRTVEER